MLAETLKMTSCGQTNFDAERLGNHAVHHVEKLSNILLLQWGVCCMPERQILKEVLFICSTVEYPQAYGGERYLHQVAVPCASKFVDQLSLFVKLGGGLLAKTRTCSVGVDPGRLPGNGRGEKSARQVFSGERLVILGFRVRLMTLRSCAFQVPVRPEPSPPPGFTAAFSLQLSPMDEVGSSGRSVAKSYPLQKAIPQLRGPVKGSKKEDSQVAANGFSNKGPCRLCRHRPSSLNDMTSHKVWYANLETCSLDPANI
ncbi:hypothetical protein DAPPUDRAFT_94739 [Daphnia pulex]|uniref:Uncharacterized protein n=1 Tax=Daphnia pulex TaxID=6669 RepID=E9FSW5_DAPPU|nr:hypothetical protein DAPPUDRAFT_94739 [Daphnia pulex]|eukprot:EFX89264.1 hypothetical protein DAPPUDRAFT_94739 [Daphnia pulex]